MTLSSLQAQAPRVILSSQEGGGIGDELTASEEALRFGWASWAIHGLFKKLTDCGDAS